MYGGAAAAEAAGFSLPPPDELATHVDWPTWQLYLKALADLLQRDDIERVRHPSLRPANQCQVATTILSQAETLLAT